jgi:hypothetical protein
VERQHDRAVGHTPFTPGQRPSVAETNRRVAERRGGHRDREYLIPESGSLSALDELDPVAVQEQYADGLIASPHSGELCPASRSIRTINVL